MKRIIFLILLFLPLEVSAARKIRIINTIPELSKAEVGQQTRAALSIIRDSFGVRYRVAMHRRATDKAPGNLAQWELWRWFQGTIGPRRHYSTIVLYRAREFGFGAVDKLCERSPFIAIAVPEDAPPDWLKFVIAHELAHSLGATHDEVPKYGYASGNYFPLSIMNSDWAVFFWRFDEGLAEFRFNLKAQLEVLECGQGLKPARRNLSLGHCH